LVEHPLIANGQNILSHRDRPIEILFGFDRTHRTRLSYFIDRIDFAACDGEINEDH